MANPTTSGFSNCRMVPSPFIRHHRHHHAHQSPHHHLRHLNSPGRTHSHHTPAHSLEETTLFWGDFRVDVTPHSSIPKPLGGATVLDVVSVSRCTDARPKNLTPPVESHGDTRSRTLRARRAVFITRTADNVSLARRIRAFFTARRLHGFISCESESHYLLFYALMQWEADN